MTDAKVHEGSRHAEWLDPFVPSKGVVALNEYNAWVDNLLMGTRT